MRSHMIQRFIFPGLVGLAAYYALFGGEYTAFDLRQIRADVGSSGVQVLELEERTSVLAARAEALEHDPRTIEALARENFGLIRDGEILYRFADGGEPADDEEAGR